MKLNYLYAFAMAAALTATPAFAQAPDKGADAPKAQNQASEKQDNAVKPENGSMKSQEAGQEKSKDAKKGDRHDAKLPQSDQEPGIKNPDKDRDKSEVNARQGEMNQHQGARQEPSEKDKQANYQFKGDAKTKLREHYKNASHVDRSHRVTIVKREVIPVEVQTRIEPVPVELVSYLGPPPAGFEYGFVDGYCLVYDPATFFVIDVIDVL